MRQPGRWALVGIEVVLVLLAVAGASAQSAPPYKVAISGPGIDGEQIVWLVEDEDAIEALHSGLLVETVGEPPGPSALPYEITWYLGQCGTESTPCSTDPEGFITHATRYAYDADVLQGALSHLDPPGWFDQPPQATESWYQTSREFDRAIQRILVLNGAPAEFFQPPIGLLPFGGSSDSTTWLIGVAVVVIAIYLMQRGRTDK